MSEAENIPATTPLSTPATAPVIDSGNPGMDTIMNINVMLSIQVGKTRMKLKELLKLTKGTVIELNKMAGEPLDILVNDELIAKGEVVVVNGNYGIRITDVTKEASKITGG